MKKKKIKAPKKKDEIKKEVLFADDKNIDYGGLPTRDLKKNLGCG
jgi:hypothetical protein